MKVFGGHMALDRERVFVNIADLQARVAYLPDVHGFEEADDHGVQAQLTA